jgi:hypothetical protein
MKTKQEYIDALNRMVEVYDNLDGCMSAINIFNEGVHLLEGLVNEHFEEKQETNLDHYFEDLLKTGGRYAFVNGKIKHCWNTRCCDCAFKGGNCHGEKIKWLASPYEKQTYKLTQFEYDLLQHFSVDFKFKEMGLLKEMKEKGHFKNINGDELIKDILESCEVIK